MKTLIKILAELIIALYMFPAILIHEVLHILFAGIFGYKSKLALITFKDWTWSVFLNYNKPIPSKAIRFIIAYCIWLIPIFGIASPILFKYGWLISVYLLSLTFRLEKGKLILSGQTTPSIEDHAFCNGVKSENLV